MERISLAGARYGERQRWRSGDEWDQRAPKIAVGELLGGGGWYVRLYDAPGVVWPRPGVCRYPGPKAEWFARRTASCWMRTLGGEWVEA